MNNTNLWQEEAERLGGPALSQLLTNLSDDQHDIKSKLDLLDDEFTSINSKLDNIMRGFPNGDADGHRRFHEAAIEWRELRNKMVRSALSEAAKVGGVAALGWVLYSLWIALKLELHK
jgi:hypothetical protein